MTARAREESGSASKTASADGPDLTLDQNALLAGIGVDEYDRIVIRVLRVQEAPPRYEEATIHFWKDTKNLCTLKGDLGGWKEVDPSRPGSGVHEELLKALRQAGAGRMYMGEAPFNWQQCGMDLFARAGSQFEVELQGANVHANRMRVPLNTYGSATKVRVR
jgi:hypothetical protein